MNDTKVKWKNPEVTTKSLLPYSCQWRGISSQVSESDSSQSETNGSTVFQSGPLVIVKNVYSSKNLSCGTYDQTSENVNIAQVALRSLPCPFDTSIYYDLIQIPKYVHISEFFMQMLYRKGK